jgi:uncharacterized NAD(P)/FAD-binding protein YdhS
MIDHHGSGVDMTVQGLFSAQAAKLRGLPRIAIVGRGFSGMMMAIALMNRVRVPFHLHLFDPNSSVSGGQALSSGNAGAILNSRVRDLSVSAGDPDDFNDWLCSNAAFRSAVPAAIPGFLQIFVPKGIFSDYVYQRFSQALALRRDITVQLSHMPVTAVRRQGAGFVLEGDGGADMSFDRVILATGYGVGPSSGPGQRRPATPSTVPARRLKVQQHTVLLGNGLAVVDKLLQLRDNGYEGQITIVSRRGFLPQSHTRRNADPVFPADALPTGLSEIMRFIRKACRDAEASGQNWQSVMNGLRKHARGLWQSLPENDKRRFDRHLRAVYDSHRNRLPEALHLRLAGEMAGGNTVLRRGWLLRQTGAGVVIRPGGQAETLDIPADRVIDCRCQAPDLSTPLMRSLFDAKLAEADELGLGLAVDVSGQVMVDGRGVDGIFAIGPLGLGSLPDIDLVPEIVSQAYGAADNIALEFYPVCRAV